MGHVLEFVCHCVQLKPKENIYAYLNFKDLCYTEAITFS